MRNSRLDMAISRRCKCWPDRAREPRPRCTLTRSPRALPRAFAFRTRMAREGLEGIVTAASSAVEDGVRAAVVTSGHHPRALLRLMAGEDLGTIFVAPLAARL